MGCNQSAAAPAADGNAKTRVIFVVGGPGAGKGTQCAKIVEKYGCQHLSTGDILRDVVKENTHPKAQELADKMSKGEFVSSADLLDFVKAKLVTLKGQLVLLDGFPRNQENMDEWKNQKLDEVCDIVAALYFNASPETMEKRLSGRNEGRADDNPEAIKHRIEKFKEETEPVVKGLPNLIDIDCNGTPEEVTTETFKQLDAKGIK